MLSRHVVGLLIRESNQRFTDTIAADVHACVRFRRGLMWANSRKKEKKNRDEIFRVFSRGVCAGSRRAARPFSYPTGGWPAGHDLRCEQIPLCGRNPLRELLGASDRGRLYPRSLDFLAYLAANRWGFLFYSGTRPAVSRNHPDCTAT